MMILERKGKQFTTYVISLLIMRLSISSLKKINIVSYGVKKDSTNTCSIIQLG
jgi:hypothetical protein